MKSSVCFFFILIVLSCASSAESDSEYRSINVFPEASVDDLKKTLNDWSQLKKAIKQYVFSESKDYYAKCDVDLLSLEHIYGIGKFSQENVKTYYSDFLHLVGSDGLRTIETKDPCFLASKHENVTWVFFYKQKKYRVVQHINVL